MFGELVVLELVLLGKLVVYEHLQSRLLIVGPGGVPPALADAFSAYTVDPPTKQGIYDLGPHYHMSQGLIDQENVYFVQDLGDTPKTTTVKSGKGKWLVISSPNADKLRYLRSNSNMQRVVMPLWSLEELEAARGTVFQGLPPTVFAGYTAAEVEDRFETYGGVPRWVLDRPRPNTGAVRSSEDELAGALVGVTLEELRGMFAAASYLELPHQKITSILIHVVPADVEGGALENNPPRCQFASERVRRLLVEELLNAERFGSAVFMNMVREIPELGGYRGYGFE